jgi:toxin ParE1/3/4
MTDLSSYKLRLTAPALDDLEEIAVYTTAKWGEQQAQAYLAQIDETIIALADNPALGREHYGVPPAIKGRKSGAHILFYRVDGDTLYILRILHESMDHGRHVDARN